MTTSCDSTASYELDLWGKNRSNMAAALATAHASVYERETVVVTLLSDVVTTYLQYLQAVERVTVAKRNIENMIRVQAKVIKRQHIGEGTELEVMQQETALRGAEANLPTLELAQDQQLNRLAYLLGTSPGELKLQGRSMDELTIPEVTPGLPSELLQRRPDIRRAEANMVAANANISMARAKLYPSLTLTADRGWSSSDLVNLMSPGSIFWTLGAKVAQTLFDNGKTNSEIAYYEARWNELIEVYRQSILASLRDVEDALSTIRRFDARNKAQIAMVRAASASYRMSEKSFGLGISDYLTVLETQRTQYNAEDGLIQSRYARYAAAVALFKALGGGTEDEVPSAPIEAKNAEAAAPAAGETLAPPQPAQPPPAVEDGPIPPAPSIAAPASTAIEEKAPPVAEEPPAPPATALPAAALPAPTEVKPASPAPLVIAPAPAARARVLEAPPAPPIPEAAKAPATPTVVEWIRSGVSSDKLKEIEEKAALQKRAKQSPTQPQASGGYDHGAD